VDADVLILGAGPAGSVAALNLAPTHRVILVERRVGAAPRIGEALPPAARRLLADMGLLDGFLAEGHTPCYGNRAVWGAGTQGVTDFMRDPDGHGWHLDRARFDSWLRLVAVARGATLIAPARLSAIRRGDGCLHVQLATDRGRIDLSAAFAIDAGGRAAPLARRLGAQRLATDRLVCGWVHGHAPPAGRGVGLTTVEAVAEGWWYTALLPGEQRVLAFLTDADLPAARIAHESTMFAEHAADTIEIGAILAESEFVPDQGGFTAAHSSTLHSCIGDGWIAAGDASMTFDPLSSQGLLHALFTGLAAAEVAYSYLSGDISAPIRYQHLMRGIQHAYRRRLVFTYSSEARWPTAPFWQRRRSGFEPQPNRAATAA
jgi:flavin-dependent dehydrogenase